MFKAGLRIKILLPLLIFSILPLLVALLLISQITQNQIEKAMALRQKDISHFVERTTTYAQLEKFNYLQLIAQNEGLASDLENFKETESRQSIENQLKNMSKMYHFDILEILNTQGELVFRFSKDERIPQITTKTHPIIEASLEEDPYYEVSEFDSYLAIVGAVPILHGNQILGHIVGAVFFNKSFANTVKSGSGAEIAFYHRGEIVGTSHPSLQNINIAKVMQGDLKQIEIEGKSHALFTNSLGGIDDGVIMALNQNELMTAISSTREAIFALLAGFGTLALVAGLTLSRNIIMPLKRVVISLKEMADGGGDLTKNLEVASKDEVGDLAGNFNRFVKRLRDMVHRTRLVSIDLIDVTEKVRTSSGEVNDGATRQFKALDDFTQAFQGIEESILGIADSTSSLLDSAEQSSSATLEMGSTNEQIASQIDKLFNIVEDVSSSINEMSSSIQQVAQNIETLSSSTESTASAITEMDTSIKQIEENAELTRNCSDEATQDALDGKNLVEETVEGIEAIRKIVDRASGAIQDLGQQSNDITQVLTVIDEIADQTSLLALNATIIAAQAGEHGKGFAVVAGEIRDLSERTAVSTKEIAKIIDNLKSGTMDAVAVMKESSEKVNQEVARSQKAGLALDKIRVSTLKSFEQAKGIVQATQEQARGSQMITSSINQVTSMLDQIAVAIRQQTDGSRQLARAAEEMKDIAYLGKNGTAEQSKGSKQISFNMETIHAMVSKIDEATREQTLRTRQSVEAVTEMNNIAENNSSRISELDQIVDILSRQTTALEEEVGAFKD